MHAILRSLPKPFAKWNGNKIVLNDTGMHKLYHARDVWWCTLGINVGFEQDGTGKDFERPVLIVKGFSKEVCLIVPLTTSQKTNPYHLAIETVNGKEANAIISQLRLIDTKRLVNKISVVDKITFKEIKKAIASFF